MKNSIIIKILILLIFPTAVSFAAINVKGKVLDKKTNKPMALCHVKAVVNGNTSYRITDKYGQFNISIKQNNVRLELEVSSVGYITYKDKFILSEKDTLLTIYLKNNIYKINEVTALSKKTRYNGLNGHYLTPKDAEMNVSVTGEVDIIKQLQVLPGVSQGMDGTLGLFVRGGNNGNNRIELDGVPIYGNTHLFGLTSVFPSQIVEGVSFKMGGIPAKHGNFLSSVTQVESKNPLNLPTENNIYISPYMLGANTNFKLKDNKIGIIMGGRYSLLKHEYNIVKKIMDVEGSFSPQVLDGFIKVNWQINQNNSISSIFFTTNDYLNYNNISDITQNWNNNIYKLEWDRNLNEETTIKTLLYYNNFENMQMQKSYDSFGNISSGLSLSSIVNDVTLKTDINKKIQNIEISTGFDIQYKQFVPASQKIVVASDNIVNFNNNLNSLLTSFYISLKQDLKEKINYDIGIRTYYYRTNNYNNLSADIRLLLDYRISDNLGVELTYDHFSQFYHVLEGLPTGWSLDLMIPASGNFTPQRSNQLYAGIFNVLGKYRLNTGIYYKTLSNLVSYKNSQNLFGVNDASWENELDSGNGKSYGVEFLVNKKGDRWNWNLAYTLSKTTREYPNINKGEIYPFKFDRRHILNLQSQLSTLKKEQKEQILFASISFSSGHKTTIAVGEYQGVTPPYWGQREGGVYIPNQMNRQAYHRQLMSPKNGYSMPNYLRFDIGYSFTRTRKKYSRNFTISVFNVTNNSNPYLYFNENNEWYQLSIFPIMPSFRYSISF